MDRQAERDRDVVVITGAGGMGVAVARRLGSGRPLVLADASRDRLDRAVGALHDDGYAAEGVLTDVSERRSVDELAAAAGAHGRLTAIVHTAGVSAATAPAPAILAVDLVGAAHVIAAFEPFAVHGTSLVCVSSMAGHYASLDRDQEAALATTPADELLGLDVVRAVGEDRLAAYILAKRGNHVRVQAAALAWNLRGARINTVSPGVISTAMSRAEAATPSGAHMLAMLDACGAGRAGTTGEVADAVAFLTGPGSRYVTGTDLLVDGGQAAWIRRHRPAGA